MDDLERKVSAIGCLVVIGWLISALFSLVISGGIIAALVAGVYYLCTGEFILAK